MKTHKNPMICVIITFYGHRKAVKSKILNRVKKDVDKMMLVYFIKGKKKLERRKTHSSRVKPGFLC